MAAIMQAIPQNMFSPVYLTDVLQRYGVKRCYYAHLHGSSIKGSINGIRNGIDYRLVSADGVGFDPVLIERR